MFGKGNAASANPAELKYKITRRDNPGDGLRADRQAFDRLVKGHAVVIPFQGAFSAMVAATDEPI